MVLDALCARGFPRDKVELLLHVVPRSVDAWDGVFKSLSTSVARGLAWARASRLALPEGLWDAYLLLVSSPCGDLQPGADLPAPPPATPLSEDVRVVPDPAGVRKRAYP